MKTALIVRHVPRAVAERTEENMTVYNMSLGDAFEEAVRECSVDPNSELYKAWYYSDFRRFIPSAYLAEYLDFRSYPLKYVKQKRRVTLTNYPSDHFPVSAHYNIDGAEHCEVFKTAEQAKEYFRFKWSIQIEPVFIDKTTKGGN